MKNFDFYEWLVYKDFPIIRIATFMRNARSLWGWKYRRAIAKGKAMMRERRVNGGDVFIVLNAPSIKEMPLERIRGMDCIFVNQGFRLPSYKLLQPKYHFFIDTKLINGTWDVGWIDEILAMVPDITFVMPAEWSKCPILKPYVDRNIKILWFNGNRNHGVSGAAFQFCWEIGYKRIYFAGYEQTAIAAYMLNQSTHFYGADPDENTYTARSLVKSLSMNARHLWAAIKTAEYADRIGVELINLSRGGIMTMFKRQIFEDVFPVRK